MTVGGYGEEFSERREVHVGWREHGLFVVETIARIVVVVGEDILRVGRVRGQNCE